MKDLSIEEEYRGLLMAVTNWKRRAEAAEARAEAAEAERDAMRADMIVCVSDARKMAADLYRAQNERDEAIAFSRGQQTIINEQRRQLEQAQRKIDLYGKAERALNKALNEGDGVYRP